MQWEINFKLIISLENEKQRGEIKKKAKCDVDGLKQKISVGREVLELTFFSKTDCDKITF